MLTLWYAEPTPGDIVWCRFPQDLPMPGPKPRPALVLKCGLAEDKPAVLVAYGTSQNTQQLYAGEFAIYPTDDVAYRRSGLSFATKFNLKKTVQLPYNNIWFSPPPVGSGITPKLGELHPLLVKRLHAAASVLSPREREKLKGGDE